MCYNCEGVIDQLATPMSSVHQVFMGISMPCVQMQSMTRDIADRTPGIVAI